MEHRKVTLPNGLRVLVSEMPETRSVSLAVYVGVGSRIETKDDAGTSHFLEHMVFKGSAKRPTAADISQVIESKGGVVNASTDKEVTVFWSRVPARHYLVALDVIADLIRAPMLRPTDVESERNVIVEELRMYRDQPQDRVHTLVDELLYPRHPLGWEVAGREEVVLGMTADRLREFMQRGYAPSLATGSGRRTAPRCGRRSCERWPDSATRSCPTRRSSACAISRRAVSSCDLRTRAVYPAGSQGRSSSSVACDLSRKSRRSSTASLLPTSSVSRASISVRSSRTSPRSDRVRRWLPSRHRSPTSSRASRSAISCARALRPTRRRRESRSGVPTAYPRIRATSIAG